jgi:hypothetical protein
VGQRVFGCLRPAHVAGDLELPRQGPPVPSNVSEAA